jgi:hypothetical protein
VPVEGGIEDDDDIDSFRFGTYESIFELVLVFTNRFEWIVIADVAAEKQWHKLKTFIVAGGGGGVEEEEVFIGSIDEQ